MSSVDFPPEQRLVFAPGGIAGNGTITIQVPDPGSWCIVSVAFRVVTDGTVATRTPVITILDGTGANIAAAAAGFGITASSTTDYAYTSGLAEWDQSNNAVASGPAPSMRLVPGDSITITLGAGVAGDAISRVRVVLAAVTGYH
jgi:hypothetical protein